MRMITGETYFLLGDDGSVRAMVFDKDDLDAVADALIEADEIRKQAGRYSGSDKEELPKSEELK